MPLDLTSAASVDQVISSTQPDLVVHLAAQSSVAQASRLRSVLGPSLTWQVNVAGSIRLASSLAQLGQPLTVLFASSVEVYGLTLNEGCLDETAVRRPQSVYARSKAAAEDALADILPANTRLIIARPSNHSGPGQDRRFVLPSFAAQIAEIELGRREPVLHVGDLAPERDFLHADDVVDAYVGLIRSANTLPPRAVFNIASGKPIAIRLLLESLLAQSSEEVEVVIDPTRLRVQDIPRVFLDNSSIREAIGWTPRRSLEALLAEILSDKRQEAAL